MIAALVSEWVRFADAYPRLAGGVKTAAVFAVMLLVLFALERLSGASTKHYRRRTFLHDTVFWLIYHGEFYRVTFTYLIVSFIAPYLAFTRIGVLDGLPLVPRFLVYFVIADFLQYWVHRCQHQYRFLWAFHAAHHSAEDLTFPASHRNHPVEQFFADIVFLVPGLILGAEPAIWVPLAYVLQFQGAIRHSELPWRYGPLYRVFVSPAFHAFHHSTRPEHIDKNFSLNLAIWDFLFGTAVDEPHRPTVYGVKGLSWTTFRQVMFGPFGLLWEYYGPRPRATRSAPETPAPIPPGTPAAMP